MKRLVLAMLCCLLTCGGVFATCAVRTRHHVNTYHAPTYHAPTHYQQHHNNVTVVKFVGVPVYTALFDPPKADDGVLKELQALRAELKALKDQPPVESSTLRSAALQQPKTAKAPSAPQNPAQSVLGLFKAKCADCHDISTADDKGGALALLDGDTLLKLTDRQAKKMLTHAYKNTMPPPKNKLGIPQLTDEEIPLLVEHADAQK